MGDLEDLRYPDGQTATVRVLALDTISQPARARVCRESDATGDAKVMVVRMMDVAGDV